jgi:hypothetical protein
MDADGDFVVTWHSYYQDPNAGLTGIYAQRYSAAGAPLDAEFRVNTTTANHQRYPAVAMDAGGRVNALDVSAIKQRLNQVPPAGLPASAILAARAATKELLE